MITEVTGICDKCGVHSPMEVNEETVFWKMLEHLKERHSLPECTTTAPLGHWTLAIADPSEVEAYESAER